MKKYLALSICMAFFMALTVEASQRTIGVSGRSAASCARDTGVNNCDGNYDFTIESSLKSETLEAARRNAESVCVDQYQGVPGREVDSNASCHKYDGSGNFAAYRCDATSIIECQVSD